MNQNGSISTVSVDSLKAWLCGWLGEQLDMDPEKVDSRQTFLSFGLNSVQAMSMVGDLEVNYKRRLAPTLAWDYPTIDALAEYLASQLSVEVAAPALPRRPERKPDPSRAELERLLAGIETIDDEEVDRLLAKYLAEPA